MKLQKDGKVVGKNRVERIMKVHDVNELVAHLDRGAQYASEDYNKKLEAFGIKASMSRKGNCYDNAMVESFFRTLKVELIYGQKFKA